MVGSFSKTIPQQGFAGGIRRQGNPRSAKVNVGNFLRPTPPSPISDIIHLIKDTERGNRVRADTLTELKRNFRQLAQDAQTKTIRQKELNGTWRLLWTTEQETLFILKNAGVFGTEAGDVYQVIDLDQGRLQNCIEFSTGGRFRVDSSIRYEAESKKCFFEFKGANIQKADGSTITLPPVGKGSFDTIFLGKFKKSFLRIAEDSRGDFLIIERVGPPRVF